MVKESQCAVQKHCSFICQSSSADTHTHQLEPTSHTSNQDQHALGRLKIAQRVHCGLPLCEVVWDVIKTLDVITPPPSKTLHHCTTTVSHLMHHRRFADPLIFYKITQKWVGKDVFTDPHENMCSVFFLLSSVLKIPQNSTMMISNHYYTLVICT